MTPPAELLIYFYVRSTSLIASFSMDPLVIGAWSSDWLWSLPIIATSVVFHSFFLRLLNQAVSQIGIVEGQNLRPQYLHGSIRAACLQVSAD